MSSDESNDDTSTNDIQAEDLRPKLRLHHLFALTAVMAVLLAIQGPQRKDVNRDVVVAPLHIVPAEWGIWGVVYQILAAAAITVLVYGIAGYRSGRTFFGQPGHWVLVEIAVSTALVFPVHLLSRSVDFSQTSLKWPVMIVVLVAILSTLSLVLGRVVLNTFLARKCSERRWKRLFYAKAFAAVFFIWADFFVILFAVKAARTDRSEGVIRDVRHWCGVAIQLAISSLAILSALVLAVSR